MLLFRSLLFNGKIWIVDRMVFLSYHGHVVTKEKTRNMRPCKFQSTVLPGGNQNRNLV